MNIAVVGASNNADKYGFRIVRHLLNEGHRVFPVNPHEKIILGQPAFRKVSEIEAPIDIVDIVVPPKATLAVIRHVRSIGKFNIWIQPGAESDDVESYIDKHSSDFGKIIMNDCIMTSLDRRFTV